MHAASGAPLHPSQPPRDWKRGFWSLIATQFQTGFNDNALKFLVTYIVIGDEFPAGAARFAWSSDRGRDVFAIPFILFSMTGGYLADRYSKRTVTIGTKLFEIAVMAFFIVSLALRSLPLECAGVFLISTEGALFGPSKYGLLPELLPETAPFLGQRHHRVRHVSRGHWRHDGSRLSRRALRGARGDGRRLAPGIHLRGAHHELRDFARPRRRSRRRPSAGTCSAISRRK